MKYKSASELMVFMKSSNNFYSDNLIDINQCIIIANNQINKIQDANPSHSFNHVWQRFIWINASIIEWGDYLEENNLIIDGIDKDIEIDNISCCFEDDYDSYLERNAMLYDEVKLIISELSSLHVELLDCTHLADKPRLKQDTLKDLFNVISLMKLIKRSLQFAKIEMKNDKSTLL